MRVGLNVTTEKIFIEMNAGGLNTTAEISSRTARALAGQLIANADALDEALEGGLLGIEKIDASA